LENKLFTFISLIGKVYFRFPADTTDENDETRGNIAVLETSTETGHLNVPLYVFIKYIVSLIYSGVVYIFRMYGKKLYLNYSGLMPVFGNDSRERNKMFNKFYTVKKV
jgi:hypothetical protein